MVFSTCGLTVGPHAFALDDALHQAIFRRYLWLSIYTTAIGGLIGLACFALSPFFPLFVMFFFVLYPAALALAAPLNLLVLPPAFHLLRDHPRRQTWLHVIGMAGGLLSPTLAAPAWCMLFEPRFPLRGLCALDPLGPSFEPALSVAFAVVGLIAGFAAPDCSTSTATAPPSSTSMRRWTRCGSRSRADAVRPMTAAHPSYG